MAIILTLVGRIHGRDGTLIAGYDERGREIRIIAPPVTCPRCQSEHSFFTREPETLELVCTGCARD